MAEGGVKGLEVAAAINPAAAHTTVGVVYTQWNPRVITALVGAVVTELLRNGVPEAKIHLLQVPGAFELPCAAERMQPLADVVICIGCLIKGETMHFEYISEAVAQGIGRLNLSQHLHEDGSIRHRSPVIYGVLECLTEAQALARAGLVPGSHNHGTEWAQSALRMAQISNSSNLLRLCTPVAAFRVQHPA